MFDDLADGLDGLDAMPPGPELAAALAAVDVSRVSGHDRVIVLRACQRMRSHYAARVYEAMTAIEDAVGGDDREAAATAEVQVALRLTRRTAEREFAFAWLLRRRLPDVAAALRAGALDMPRARVLVEETLHVDRATAERVVAEALPDAPGRTTTQLRRRLRRACIAADPGAATRRYEEAVADRRVALEPTVEGTAHLAGYDLPPERAAAAMAHLTELARRCRRPGETRTLAQLRADVLLDLLTGATTGQRPRVRLNLTADLATLVGLADDPGHLDGYGPVVADLARRLTEEPGTWSYTITDPDTGRPLHAGTTRRRPTAGQRRAVEARDPTCIFPGCVVPAPDCDLDHRIPWAESRRTRIADLAPLHRADHTLRHQAGWTYEPYRDGDWLWTTRLGHRYTTSGTPP